MLLQVGGMTCSACCAAVESALDGLPGVTNAVVSLIQQQARVEYHPNVISVVSFLTPACSCIIEMGPVCTASKSLGAVTGWRNG